MSKELTPLERLSLMVPGYRGYKVKDLIRQDDMLVRMSVRQKVENTLERLASLGAEFVSVNPFDPRAKVVERLSSRLRGLLGDLVAEQTGGATIYSRWKMFPEALREVVNYDLQLVTLASDLETASIRRDLEGLETVIGRIQETLRARHNLFFPPEARG